MGKAVLARVRSSHLRIDGSREALERNEAMQRDTAAALDLDYVEAPLNYLAPGSEKPFVYTAAPPPGMPQRSGRFEPQMVASRNGRPLQRRLSLDKEGFALARHATDVVDFYDDAQVSSPYYPEIEPFLREATGATKVVIFDHTVRNTAPEQQAARRVREPAASVHNDYTDKSAPQRGRDLLDPAEADARLQRRDVARNVSRP